MELWLRRLPPLRIADNSTPKFNAFGVFGMEDLHLQWDLPDSAATPSNKQAASA
ncbi:hypothetical protein D3C75_1355110 [compost metagenome]